MSSHKCSETTVIFPQNVFVSAPSWKLNRSYAVSKRKAPFLCVANSAMKVKTTIIFREKQMWRQFSASKLPLKWVFVAWTSVLCPLRRRGNIHCNIRFVLGLISWYHFAFIVSVPIFKLEKHVDVPC